MPPARGFLPSVFDRLTDPDSMGPGGAAVGDLIEAVRRDVEDLLNTRRVTDPAVDDYPELSRSVFAYGMPELVSRPAVAAPDREAIGRLISDAVARHEPRIRNVRTALIGKFDPTDRSVRFKIEGTLRVEPGPGVEFETVLELSSGQATVNVRAS